jgi:glycosyltransferase involved in cell wall biosynthesis
MRICIVYDCLFPWTVGGGERWYRNLAERLAGDGHEVTYLTLRQWPADQPPALPGVRVVAVGPRLRLYDAAGRRRIGPPLVFGAGVLAHLLHHGRRYDVVHTSAFPYFSLLAAGLARRVAHFGLVVDWLEVWSREYWREYLGAAAGAVGYAVQLACVRIPQRAFCFSRLHRDRLLAEGLRSAPHLLEGMYTGDLTPPEPNHAQLVAVFAGRHIPEKRAPAVVSAIGLARERLPELRGTILGDGPERPQVLEAIAREGLGEAVQAPGFVDTGAVDAALRDALCMVLPSRREGYGMIVVESAARGTPSVVVREPDNAAVELVQDGVNGVIAESAEPQALADAIVRVHRAGPALRESTCAWFAHNARRMSLGHSVEQVTETYARWATARS